MSGRSPDYQVTIHGVVMTLSQASKLTGVPVCTLWKAAQESLDLTPYLERRKLNDKIREASAATGVKRDTLYRRLARGVPFEEAVKRTVAVSPPKRPRKSSELWEKAKRLAAHPEASVGVSSMRTRLKAGWTDDECVYVMPGAW